jgi:hypothetical protein
MKLANLLLALCMSFSLYSSLAVANETANPDEAAILTCKPKADKTCEATQCQKDGKRGACKTNCDCDVSFGLGAFEITAAGLAIAGLIGRRRRRA